MGETPTLYTTDDTGNYVEYTPPEPPAFKDTLPEDIRGSEHLSDVEDNTQLARYYVDLKSNYLKPPDSAEGYEFEKPNDFHLNDEQLAEYKKTAFESGMNQKQFGEWMKFETGNFSKSVEALRTAIATSKTEGEKALKAEWGDNYEKNVNAAMSVLKNEKLADEKFVKFLEDSRFGDNPAVVRFFHKLSESLAESAFVKSEHGSGGENKHVGEDGRPMLHFPSMA